MKQRPLVILSSARKESDTKSFVDMVFRELPVDIIDLLDYSISPFNYENTYATNDEFQSVVENILQHQVIVFATPVYWYAMSGQLKVLFDRFTDLVTVKKQTGRQLKGKSTFLIAVGADKELPHGFEVPFLLTSNYLNLSYEGCIFRSTKWPKHGVNLENEMELFRSNIKRY